MVRVLRITGAVSTHVDTTDDVVEHRTCNAVSHTNTYTRCELGWTWDVQRVEQAVPILNCARQIGQHAEQIVYTYSEHFGAGSGHDEWGTRCYGQFG